jgi:hypothetical protein
MASKEGHKRTASTVGLKGSRPSSPEVGGPDRSSVGPGVGGSLEALLSPQAQENGKLSSERRDSVAETVEVEVGVDESHFSNVPLSAGSGDKNGVASALRNAAVSIANRASSSSQTDRPLSYSITQSASTPQPLSATRLSHKKSASTTTLDSNNRTSAGNLPFLLHRLDLQKVQEDASPTSHRLSLDGQHRIQEEFSRLQSSKTEASNDSPSETIDWGTCLLHRRI